MPEDYVGSVSDQLMNHITSGNFKADGDKDKAAKAVYEVVVSEGVGAGHEGAKFLPLGRDLAVRVKEVQDQYTQTMGVFGDVCNNVYLK